MSHAYSKQGADQRKASVQVLKMFKTLHISSQKIRLKKESLSKRGAGFKVNFCRVWWIVLAPFTLSFERGEKCCVKVSDAVRGEISLRR